jgi:hypothetical protein
MVERLVAFRIAESAICAELVRDGVNCRSAETLRKRFKQEIALGQERMVNLLGHRVLEIALSDRPNNLTACLAILRTLRPEWREPRETGTVELPEVPVPPGAMIYPRLDLEREMPAAVEIEGESVEVAEHAPEERPAEEKPPRKPIEI